MTIWREKSYPPKRQVPNHTSYFEYCLLMIMPKMVFPKIRPILNEWTFHSLAQYSPFVVVTRMFLVNWFYDVLYYLGT